MNKNDINETQLISNNRNYEAIVIGVSAGGMKALPEVLSLLPKDFLLPIIIVQHIDPLNDNDFFVNYLNEKCLITVKEADEKEYILAGTVYIAPPNYHLLVEQNRTFSLSIDKKINFSRPNIDVWFESASYVYQSGLIGVILTGANDDGTEGMKIIKNNGGYLVAQDPSTAESKTMLQSAIDNCYIDQILNLSGIGKLLVTMSNTLKKKIKKDIT